MSRFLITVLSLSLLFISACQSPHFAPVGPVAASAPNAPKPVVADGPQQIILAECDRFRLFYPEAFCELMPLQEVLTRTVRGFAQVEHFLGEFTQQIDIYVALKIKSSDPEFPDNLIIQGLTFEDKGRIVVFISLLYADAGTYAHEFTHARLRDLKVNPPRWLEEGLAHFNDYPDGFNPELFAILADAGPLPLTELDKDEGLDMQEMRRRATGWAVAYYLLNIKGCSVQQVAQLARKLEPEEAAAAVRLAAASRNTAPNTETTIMASAEGGERK